MGPLRMLITAGRFFARFVVTMCATTFCVFAGIEVSIDGGFRTVVFPPGLPENSPRGRELIDTWNLDGNIFVRWFGWFTDVIQGELGQSSRLGGTDVWDLIVPRLSISLQLMLGATALAVAAGIPLGLWAAALGTRGRGRFLTALLGVSQSVPVFISSLFFVWLFAVELRWLPAAGWVRISESIPRNLESALLPVTTLALAEVGIIGRIVQRDASELIRSDFVASALGKGLSMPYVMTRHVLRPASLGLLNVLGVSIGSLLSGALIVELIFGIGGLGQVVFESLINRDLYLVLGLTIYIVGVYVTLNTAVDIATLLADPRIRRRGRTG